MSDFNPADTYDLLLKQFYAMRNLIKSQEGTISVMKKNNDALMKELHQYSQEEINGLRDTIEQLTNELERNNEQN